MAIEKDLLKTDKKLDNLYNYSGKYSPIIWLEKIGLTDIDIERVKHAMTAYAVPLIFGVSNLLMSVYFGQAIDRSFLYLAFTIVNAASAWFGGVSGAMISVGIAILGMFYLSQFMTGEGIGPILLIQSAALFLNALIVGYVVSWSRRRDETIFYKEKERVYARTFHEIYEEYTKALNEIKARDQFLTIASHELKTPLTSMLLKLSGMLNSIRNVSLAHFSVSELMKVLQNAQDQIRWLTAMINDLLNVSLMTTGRMSLQKQRVDLVTVARTVKENFSEHLRKEGYKVDIEAPAEVIGNWDKTRIEQAVTNLFSNALKYGKNRPIQITISNSGNTAKFVIKDNGIGIAREDQKILFKPFERPKAVEGYKKGLGVGLYLTRMIASSHGGDVKVKSKLNSGTTFIMELPLNKKTV